MDRYGCELPLLRDTINPGSFVGHTELIGARARGRTQCLGDPSRSHIHSRALPSISTRAVYKKKSADSRTCYSTAVSNSLSNRVVPMPHEALAYVRIYTTLVG